MPRDPGFPATRWTLVRRAVAPADAKVALGELCELYWYPLYVFLRRCGRPADAAQDLVQEFCAELLAHGGLAGFEPGRGAFRTYLLGALRHFVANAERASRAAKRGGGVRLRSLGDAELRYASLATSAEGPELLFERAWAMAVLATARERLRGEQHARGRGDLFEALAPALAADAEAGSRAELAEQLGTTPGALKVALHRMRMRLGELIREEVAETLESPADLEGELGALFTALGPPRPR